MSRLSVHVRDPQSSDGHQGTIPLVLLHAFPLDSRMWEPMLAELGDLPVVTVDAPGFGASPPASQLARSLGCPIAPSLRTYAEAVASALRAEGIERAVVAGLSMGGYTALALAEQHPEMLAGLGLLDTKATADTAQARATRIRMAERVTGALGTRAAAPMIDTIVGETTRRERPEVVETVRTWLAAAPPAGVAWAQRAMAGRRDRLATLAGLSIPALVLRGAEDATIGDDDVAAMARQFSDADVVTVPGAGHLSALETPAAVARPLRQLWQRAAAAE